MYLKRKFAVLALIFLGFAVNVSAQTQNKRKMESLPQTTVDKPNHLEVATFGGGCFWCTEAIYQDLLGVSEVKSGYSGGNIHKPTYNQVTSGTTGHAEVIQFLYDPKIISYQELLEIFWSTHDPTTLNRQGADVGPQYRSVVFFHSNEQQEMAQLFKEKLNQEKVFKNPIVTEITAFSNFYLAENYHQNYFKENGAQPYCQFVILPKVEKFRKVFAEKLR
jgi:peptide-methionine (S)-S-oxide reductase